MTYTEFKKEHDKLVAAIIFTDAKQADTLVERLERLRLDNEKHFNQLWGEL
jgi:hypothetical protein